MAHSDAAAAWKEVTPHLNSLGLRICETPTAGRGVVASHSIARDVVVEISPVLLFAADEYQAHGRHTQLDSYTFVWEKRANGSTMALALGLGSLFNHSTHANVSYQLNRAAQCIQFRTVRDIAAGEELCICYGAGKMWWETDDTPNTPPATETDECTLFGQMDLADADDTSSSDTLQSPTYVRAPVDTDAPLWRITASPDPHTMPLDTMLAWALDAEPRNCASVARVLQALTKDKVIQSGAQLRHLRTFRKACEVTRVGSDENKLPGNDKTDRLAVLVAAYGPQSRDELVALLAPALGDLAVPELYLVRVPVCAAPSRTRLAEWASVWPCIFLPPGAGLATGNALPGSDAARAATLVDRAQDAARWQSPCATDWIRAGFARCLKTACAAQAAGEIGCAAFVTEAPDAQGQVAIALDANDTRTRDGHPLRHAVPNAVRAVAEWRAARRTAPVEGVAANGQDYLLTGLSLFLTHEPGRAACLGGEDGGPYAIHEQSGLNHHYDVWRWVDPNAFPEARGLASAIALDL
ncbi:tRNA-specific adenosine deaminase subunit tad3 [Malassezia brasiliensis]|uniref:tRNA-specific adenosine deaminase subunit tad3 n=1 Tax=Malassezia brasiliensis TaxID=1821822 RepID=A0AAF0DWA1_9BASI|nr:tRNA-specific adenosine deaminase subunit tad3 [Malassezia brasiliensis]